jgi:hypothetical protein
VRDKTLTHLVYQIQSFARDFINIKSFRTSGRKAKIREAYKILTGEEIKLSCNTCYIEAIFTIIKSQPMATRKYELKKGVVLTAFGDASKTCTNDTITDELGDWYMKHYPDKAIYFSRVPGSPVVPPSVKVIPPTIKIIPPVEVVSPVEPEVSEVAETLINTVTQSPKRGRKSSK